MVKIVGRLEQFQNNELNLINLRSYSYFQQNVFYILNIFLQVIWQVRGGGSLFQKFVKIENFGLDFMRHSKFKGQIYIRVSAIQVDLGGSLKENNFKRGNHVKKLHELSLYPCQMYLKSSNFVHRICWELTYEFLNLGQNEFEMADGPNLRKA